MRATCRGFVFAVAMAAIGSGGGVQAQQAAPQYYGYPSSQQAVPSGQANYACQPGPGGCYVERHGCHVKPCECPCDVAYNCQIINSYLPPIKPLPTCYEAQVCEVISEAPVKERHIDVPIYRNCYVPIRVKTVDTHPNDVVTTVDFQVKWRNYHVICDEKGVPMAPEKAAAILQEMQARLASADSAPAPPSATVPPTPTPTPTPTPVAAAPQPTPEKRWVWLPTQNLFGFGYQRPDGYWVIDQGSKRPTLPGDQAAVNASPVASAATTTASN